MKQIFLYTVFLGLLFISCKQTLKEDDKRLIKEQIKSDDNSIEVINISSRNKIIGNFFSLQTFEMKIKVLKSCVINLNEHIAIPTINTAKKNDSNLYMDINMIDEFSVDSIIIVSGVLFSSNSSTKYFETGMQCLFYLPTKKTESDKIAELYAEICSDLSNYENTYLNVIKNLNPKDYENLRKKEMTFADKNALRFLGGSLIKIRRLENLRDKIIDWDTYQTHIENTDALLYLGLETKELNCN